MVQKDPEDFLCDVGDFLTPEFVWSWDVHSQNEGYRLICLCFLGFSQVGEDLAGSLLQIASV